MTNEKIITVFGSSTPKPGDEEYENAYKLGKLLANTGFNVCNGGAQGIMDAVSKGAKEEGKSVIGVTVNIFDSMPSEHLTSEIQCETLFERIDNLVKYGDGFIILPGGTGTLLELSVIWELMNKNVIEKRPIACLGNIWKTVVETIDERLEYEKKKSYLVKCFDTVEEIVDYLKNNIK
jgi:uncharacterized protein (TIGR00730 family)